MQHAGSKPVKLGSMSYLQGIATPESDPDTTNQTEKENTV